MSDKETSDDAQPVFHGAPAQPEAPQSKDGKVNKALAAGLVFGIGSAAVVAALLYTRKTKNKPTAPVVTPEPSD